MFQNKTKQQHAAMASCCVFRPPEVNLPCLILIPVINMIGFASCKAGRLKHILNRQMFCQMFFAKCFCQMLFAQMSSLLSNNKCQLAVQGVLHLSTMYSHDMFLKMYFPKCISRNVFSKMSPSKCIFQNALN